MELAGSLDYAMLGPSPPMILTQDQVAFSTTLTLTRVHSSSIAKIKVEDKVAIRLRVDGLQGAVRAHPVPLRFAATRHTVQPQRVIDTTSVHLRESLTDPVGCRQLQAQHPKHNEFVFMLVEQAT